MKNQNNNHFIKIDKDPYHIESENKKIYKMDIIPFSEEGKLDRAMALEGYEIILVYGSPKQPK